MVSGRHQESWRWRQYVYVRGCYGTVHQESSSADLCHADGKQTAQNMQVHRVIYPLTNELLRIRLQLSPHLSLDTCNTPAEDVHQTCPQMLEELPIFKTDGVFFLPIFHSVFQIKCVKFINYFNDLTYTISRSLNPLQKGCENLFFWGTISQLCEMPFQLRREKYFLSSLISMGVSK